MSRPWEMFHGTCSMCDSRATDCMCCDTCLATDPVGRDRGFRPRKDNKFPATPQSPNLMEENFKVGALRDFEDAMELYLPILRFVESGAVASYEDLPPPLRRGPSWHAPRTRTVPPPPTSACPPHRPSAEPRPPRPAF